MNVNTRLDKTFTYRSRSGSGNETWTRSLKSLVNYRTKLNKVLIGQLFRGFIVQVYEKLEVVRLLFDDVQF